MDLFGKFKCVLEVGYEKKYCTWKDNEESSTEEGDNKDLQMSSYKSVWRDLEGKMGFIPPPLPHWLLKE